MVYLGWWLHGIQSVTLMPVLTTRALAAAVQTQAIASSLEWCFNGACLTSEMHG